MHMIYTQMSNSIYIMFPTNICTWISISRDHVHLQERSFVALYIKTERKLRIGYPDILITFLYNDEQCLWVVAISVRSIVS